MSEGENHKGSGVGNFLGMYIIPTDLEGLKEELKRRELSEEYELCSCIKDLIKIKEAESK